MFSISLFYFAQNVSTDSFDIRIIQNENKLYSIVEQMPEFMGGEGALFKFIQQNLVYPTLESGVHLKGTVITNCIINEDGTLSNFSIKIGLHPAFDMEAGNKCS